MAIESLFLLDLPIENAWSFHSYLSRYQRVNPFRSLLYPYYTPYYIPINISMVDMVVDWHHYDVNHHFNGYVTMLVTLPVDDLLISSISQIIYL